MLPTQVLVLGTSHFGPAFSPHQALTGTTERLRRWAPDVIAVEYLPGDLAEQFRQMSDPLAAMVAPFVAWRSGPAGQAQAVVGLSRAEAAQRAEAEADPAQAASLWLAADEPASAVLNWMHAGYAPLVGDLHHELKAIQNRGDEIMRLALPLAHSLGHRSVSAIDDHTGLEIYLRIEAELDIALKEHPTATPAQDADFWAESRRLHAALLGGADFWPVLELLNSPEAVTAAFQLESESWLRLPTPSGAGRARLAQWEARNLFMAARLRQSTARFPGGRVLALVGSSHKGPLEAALRPSPDVQVTALSSLNRG